jgi:hypothetical protein
MSSLCGVTNKIGTIAEEGDRGGTDAVSGGEPAGIRLEGLSRDGRSGPQGRGTRPVIWRGAQAS